MDAEDLAFCESLPTQRQRDLCSGRVMPDGVVAGQYLTLYKLQLAKKTRRQQQVQAARSRGLGDTIAKVTEATGIAKVVKAVSKATGIPCGCKKRQEALNKLVPYSNSDCQKNDAAEST